MLNKKTPVYNFSKLLGFTIQTSVYVYSCYSVWKEPACQNKILPAFFQPVTLGLQTTPQTWLWRRFKNRSVLGWVHRLISAAPSPVSLTCESKRQSISQSKKKYKTFKAKIISGVCIYIHIHVYTRKHIYIDAHSGSHD